MQGPDPVPTQLVTWLDLVIGPRGLVVGLLLVLYGVVKENPWWIPGNIYRRTEQKLDALQAIVTANTVIVARSVGNEARREQRESDAAEAELHSRG